MASRWWTPESGCRLSSEGRNKAFPNRKPLTPSRNYLLEQNSYIQDDVNERLN